MGKIMKFDIGSLNEYTGSDLIFVIGAPGSRWSSTAKIICESSQVNISDRKSERQWSRPLTRLNGETGPIGSHFGAYWGPGNLFGQRFDYLHSLSKQELLSEFMEAFDNWDGKKVIKSHWFAYNIPYLNNVFPDAKIVMCYVPDVECWYWWHKCGGWGSKYANYSWYENDERMLEQIKQENSHILKFGIDRDLQFKRYETEELWRILDITPVDDISIKERRNLKKNKLAIYTGGWQDNFSGLI